MGADLQQSAVLSERAVATDVEVIAYGAETPQFVGTHQLLDGEILIAAGGAAVHHDVAHSLRTTHLFTHLALQQLLLVGEADAANGHRKTLSDHGLKDCTADDAEHTERRDGRLKQYLENPAKHFLIFCIHNRKYLSC